MSVRISFIFSDTKDLLWFIYPSFSIASIMHSTAVSYHIDAILYQSKITRQLIKLSPM